MAPEWADLLLSCFGLTVIGWILLRCGLLRLVERPGMYTVQVTSRVQRNTCGTRASALENEQCKVAQGY